MFTSTRRVITQSRPEFLITLSQIYNLQGPVEASDLNMAEGKIEIPPPIGLLDTDSYSAKANRVTSATSVTTTFEYTITHADGSQVIQIVQDTNGDREVVETKELPATAASKAAARIWFLGDLLTHLFYLRRGAGREPGACWDDWPRPGARLSRVHNPVARLNESRARYS